MKKQLDPRLEEGRIRHGQFGTDASWGSYGAFFIHGPCGEELKIVSSGGDETGWEHVSISTRRRTPNWREMCFVKDLFWDDTETVLQLHPPKADYINNHPHCLHLWKPLKAEIPLPPSILVGLKSLNGLSSETIAALVKSGFDR